MCLNLKTIFVGSAWLVLIGATALPLAPLAIAPADKSLPACADWRAITFMYAEGRQTVIDHRVVCVIKEEYFPTNIP